MIVRDFGAVILGVLATIVIMDYANRFLDREKETKTNVCVEYMDESGHKVKECELYEATTK